MEYRLTEKEYFDLVNKANTSALQVNRDLKRETEDLKRSLKEKDKEIEGYLENIDTMKVKLDQKYFRNGFYKLWVIITTLYLIASVIDRLFGSVFIPPSF